MNTKHPLRAALATLLLTILSPLLALAQTVITDDFTDPTKWGPPICAPGKNIFVTNGCMNFTSTSNDGGGALIPRIEPLLPTTQDWSLKVGMHVDPFTLVAQGHYIDVFLGFGKTGDWFNTHVMFEFDRGWWLNSKGYDIGDDVRFNGVDAPGLFEVGNLTSPDASLRLDYNAANHTITYLFDADGAANGYNWSAQGTANLASGAYNLNLGPTDTLTVILAGSSSSQVVTAGQAYLDNLEITIYPTPPPFTWITNNGTITITGYTGTNGLVAIPSVITGLSVTSIGDGAFRYSTILTNVVIPNSVTTIGSSAFYYCTSLTTVTLGNSVTSIGGDAFSACSRLASITIPNSVTTIGSSAFAQCFGLATVAIPNSVTTIGPQAFSDCYGLTSINLGNGVTSLGNGAFSGCIKLTSVMIPSGVTTIENRMFTSCSSLASVTIPDSVTNIGDYAFSACSKLGSISIPNSVFRIGDRAFADSGLRNVTIPDSVTNIGNYAFYYSGLVTVTIGNGVTTIGSSAFVHCTGLTSATIGTSVTSIGGDAFYDCTSLTTVCFLGNAPSLGSYVFLADNKAIVYYLQGATGWSSTFGGRPTVLWDPQMPFTYITNNGTITITGPLGSVTALTIPTTINGLPVASIGSGAFRYCTSLTSVMIPSGATSIGDNAFAASSLTSVTIPDSVTSIGSSAFNSCYSLTSVTIPSSVTTIGDAAFFFCTSLTNVTIGNMFPSLGSLSFYSCTNLTGAYFRGHPPVVYSDVFFGDNSLIIYYLPGNWWGTMFYGHPTALWQPQIQSPSASTGTQTNQFGFNIAWASGMTVVVEASTSTSNPTWSPVSTNTLVNGTSYFTDPNWTNYPSRFYRVRSP